MNFITIMLIIAALLYLLSPYDVIPDLFPVTGWFDDAFLLGILIYYLKYRQLPGFLSRLVRSSRSQTYNHSNTKSKGADPDSSDPYQVLGLKPGAGPDEIRAAYRRAAQAYHPDKVSHLGPELRELAQKKFVEIRKAYDMLVRKSG